MAGNRLSGSKPDEPPLGGSSIVAPTTPDPNNRLSGSGPDEPPMTMTPTQAAAPPPPPPPSTPLDQPMPSFLSRPAGQGIGGYLSDTWAHVTQGGLPAAIQQAKDTGRVAADTWSIGQGDRALAAATGTTTAAERANTDAAHARLQAISPGMDYAAQSLGYIVPGPMDLAAPLVGGAKLTQAAAPYVRQAIPAASKAAQDAIARVSAYAANSGITAAAQDIGHDIYNPAQVIGDTAVGATIGGAVHGATEAAAAGASKAKDWVKSIMPGYQPLPSGAPADITAANPTNPHAAKLEEWQNNMAVTGEPPKPSEVEAYGNQQFGADKSKWPAEYQNIYKAVQPRGPLGLIPRAAIGAGTFGLQYATGLADNPLINYGVQAGLAGTGELGSRLYTGDPVARADRAISGSYPALTGWESIGTKTSPTWTDAIHRGIALPLAQPQN
jgi:hypothetical protein